jgi:YfiH family protein
MWITETSPIGRIVVPPDLPPGFAFFCTTRDYRGKIVPQDLLPLVESRFGLKTSLTTCNQVHSATVVEASQERSWRECEACDALWTSERGVSIAVKVADCLPVTLIDVACNVIANIHSGWRGAVQGITDRTLDAAPLDPSTTRAWLGPSIRVCCFEVGEEVAERFDERFLDRRPAKPHVDIVAFTADILRARGITQISDSGLCTRCDGSIFHSYRREGPGGGRNLIVVGQ